MSYIGGEINQTILKTADAAASVNPFVLQSYVAGKQAIFFTAVAKKIVENVLDVGNDILDSDIKPILKKYGDLTSEFSVEILKTYNSIDESIQKERYKAEIIKAIQTELIKRAKDDIPDNLAIQQISKNELNQILNKLNQQGGSSIKHIQRGGQQSLKRTAKSINEFLNSSVTASHIINMVKKGGKTKRKLSRHAKKYKTRRQI
jgi:hypothetical protein